MTDPDRSIVRYFDAFVTAFASFDGKAVGSLFIAPGVALKGDGVLQGFTAQADVEAYYQAALDHYRAQGCTGCRYVDLDVRMLNATSAIATASWDLLRADGSIISHWRQSYFLARFDGAWRAYGSAFVSV